MLLDSNIIIYSALPAHSSLLNLLQPGTSVSAVSLVEVLGFPRLASADKMSFEKFFASATVLPLDQAVIKEAINLRSQRSMKLGDALVAGTAIVHNLTLVTHNTKDFSWIGGLSLLDPLNP